MKIERVEVKNFRLLKNFSIELEKVLSLVIGKNNCGKTSLLTVIDKFINHSDKNSFKYDDFNMDCRKTIDEIINDDEIIKEENYENIGIEMTLFIKYTDTCNLEKVSKVLMTLDEENYYIALRFEFTLSFEKYVQLRKDYEKFLKHEEEKVSSVLGKDRKYVKKSLDDFLKKNYGSYFKINKKSLEVDKSGIVSSDANFIDLDKEKININKIISFKYISAKREVANREADKTLSLQTSKLYDKIQLNPEQSDSIERFEDSLSISDADLTRIYNEELFLSIKKTINKFGGIKPNDTRVSIISDLQHKEILKGNTTVVYSQNSNFTLPEHLNGLGYMNLISMIFEIEYILEDFKGKKDEKPACINLFFIEEPEAHTHPQMQYVFIRNIKNLLKLEIKRTDGEKVELQTIISTHSSHIVADSDFNDIKYLKKNKDEVIAKNLIDLKQNCEEKVYGFLKKYLTLNRAELFFADKVILIEGDTERLLIPSMMKQIDIEDNKEGKDPLPMLSQNISVVEVGAYAKNFSEFIEFLGIKTLIITDLDSVSSTIGENGKHSWKACRVEKIGENIIDVEKKTSNSTLKYFFKEDKLMNFLFLKNEEKIFKYVNGKWEQDKKGNLKIAFQTKEKGYNARSFEDSFIHINREFIITNINEFESLKNINFFSNKSEDSYSLADSCISKKTSFALDIINFSDNELTNWKTPSYIKEGLKWLKKD